MRGAIASQHLPSCLFGTGYWHHGGFVQELRSHSFWAGCGDELPAASNNIYSSDSSSIWSTSQQAHRWGINVPSALPLVLLFSSKRDYFPLYLLILVYLPLIFLDKCIISHRPRPCWCPIRALRREGCKWIRSYYHYTVCWKVSLTKVWIQLHSAPLWSANKLQ